MTTQVRFFPVAACLIILFSLPAFAQTAERRQTSSTTQAQDQSPNFPANASSIDVVANEIGLLRKSLQTLNTRLREISEKVFATDAGQSNSANNKQNRMALILEILTRAEQRAEVLRKQLIELIEKETLLKSRLMQTEEDMRPENIERAMNLVGTTRTTELRDVRRKVLENERKGFENLLGLTAQNRLRLEDDVRQADLLVSKLRQRLIPMIEKEIENLSPD